MTMKEIAKKIIASINPGNADISGIGDGTIKGALVELNSNLSGNFIYESRQSAISFMDADNTKNTVDYAGCLDYVVHPNIGSYDTDASVFVVHNNGPVWFVLLGKQSSSYYAGQIWSYSNLNGPVSFAYRNGTYCIYKPKQIS